MEDKQPINSSKKPMRIISVTGGKGGIGKTTLSVNLSVAFSKMGKKVLLFDADLGLANVDVMLGLNPNRNIHDVLAGGSSINEVCINGPHGLKIVPSSSGIQKMADLSPTDYVELIRSFSSLTDDIDIMIIDMASGISSQVIDFTQASQDILVVICNDPSSLMDSYAVIKILHQKYARSRFGIVVNKVKGAHEGFDVFSKFQEVTAKFINISMNYLGHVPADDYVNLAARERVCVVDKYPQSNAVIAINNLCYAINNWNDESSLSGGIQFFFERLVQSR
ncbi:MAG: AAA family ATPase [Gammaproteobacteria bacterium]